MREGQTITIYQNIFTQQKVLNKRIEDLAKIKSQHVLFVDRVEVLGKHGVKIIYKEKWNYHLDQFINQNKEMLPSQIKYLIMQIVKAMTHIQKLKINHFRLCPKAISFNQVPFHNNGVFLKIKDFSFGNEFQQVKDGKLLYIFEFLHPNLSVKALGQNLFAYLPSYDIWSLGIILYKLIYFKNPFAKQGKTIFSKTILRKYLAGQHEIRFQNNKFLSVNNFIQRCLTIKGEDSFSDWNAVKYFILQEEEIYNNIDFQDCTFRQTAQQHIKLMHLFSSVHLMIIEQCNSSPHYFWKIAISQKIKTPFVTLICEAILFMMVQLNSRFQRIFSSHQFMLKGTKICNALDIITSCIASQINIIKWHEPSFTRPLSFIAIKKMLQICARGKIQMLQVDTLSFKLNRQNFRFFGYATNYKYDSLQKRMLWKNIQVLYDFCHQVIDILNVCRNRTKQLYERVYTSSLFNNLAINFFGFNQEHILETFDSKPLRKLTSKY